MLLALGYLHAYARAADPIEATYNTARAHHHLGLVDTAMRDYEKCLELARQRRAAADPPAAAAAEAAAAPPLTEAQDLSRESAHNLALILVSSGNKDLARSMMRAMPV